jgi:hypothetical protein
MTKGLKFTLLAVLFYVIATVASPTILKVFSFEVTELMAVGLSLGFSALFTYATS